MTAGSACPRCGTVSTENYADTGMCWTCFNDSEPQSEPTNAESYHRPAPKARTRTDLGNAELLVEMHGHRLRYVGEWNRWLIWADGRWRRDVTGEAHRAAKDTVRSLLAIAAGIQSEDECKQAVAWAIRSQSSGRVTAMLELARTEELVAVSALELDQHPMLLACSNGTLDLRTGRLRIPDPNDLITKGTDVPFLADAKCPRFERFLNEVFEGDSDLIAFLQRFAGYCLTGHVTEHVFAVFHGNGRNGKSTLLKVLASLLGSLGQVAGFDTFARARRDGKPRDDLFDLMGARLVMASESGEGRHLDEAIVKSITGGDIIKARPLYGTWVEFDPTFKIVLSTNARPRVDGDDDAIWARLRLVPFNVSFEGREDRGLGAALEAELPGILNWALRGCLDWRRDGLGKAAAVTQATSAYKEQEDVLGAFLEACCKSDGSIKATVLRGAYESYCEEQGERPLPSNTLGGRLHKRGVASRKSGGRTVYDGISLRDAA